MKAIHQIKTKQILKEARIFLPLLATTFLTITSAYILSSHTSTALDQKSISASVKVSDSCSMQISDDGKATLDNPYEMIGGTYDDNVKNVNISMSCNDRNGFSLYAVGFSNNEIGNTNLISTANGNIPTGLDTTTLNSNWAFKFTPVTTSSYVPTIVSDSEGSFASFHKIPSTNTKVATFTDAVEVTGSSSVTATYAVGVSPYQAPDTYTGQVKFTLVHPNFADSEQRVYMQDLTPSMIADLLPNVGNTFTAYDKRDNQSYKIAKLADGKYWMVENLNLAGGTTITPADSNVTENYTLPASATKNADNNNLTDATQFSDNATAYVFNSGNKTNCGASGQNIPCGSYYSYLAATAGTGANVAHTGYNTSGSICPKGWRLPTSTTSNANPQLNDNWKTGDYYALATAYGANLESNYSDNSSLTGANFYNNAGPSTVPNFQFSGFYMNSTLYNIGSRGTYWSATSYSELAAYNMNVSSQLVDPTGHDGRMIGFSVRCVFETRDITDISTMQEISPAIAANTPVGTSTTLTDSRGGVTKSYTVAKLADNKVWMTSNLDLPGGTTITIKDSDVTTNFTLPTSATKNADNNNLTDSTQFTDDNTAYVFNSGNNTNCGASGQNIPCGSYYSYLAATAGTGASINGNGVNATSSICPKGWRLPTATTESIGRDSGGYTGGEFYQMILAVTGQSSLADGYYESTANFYNNAGPGTTPGFLLAGYYDNSTLKYGGSDGYSWSSTSLSGTNAYSLVFNSSIVNSASNSYRRHGFSVRCLAKS